MNRPNPAEEQEAARLEEFLMALHHDPASSPGELDPILAEVTRLTAESEKSSSLTAKPYAEAAKNRVWQKALASLETEKAGTVEKQPTISGSLSGQRQRQNKAKNEPELAYLLPEEPVSMGRKVNWPRIVLGGMAASIVVILVIFVVALLSPSPQVPGGVIGAGTEQTTPKQASQSTPTLAVPTATPQPTPTPYPATIVTLQIAADNFTSEQANTTARVLENRMSILGFSYAKATISGKLITLNLRGTIDQNFDFKTATTVGRVEFVDASGGKTFKEGDFLQTTYCTLGTLLKPQTGLCVPTSVELSPGYTSVGYTNQNGKPFQTILSGEDIDTTGIQLAKDDTGNDKALFKLKPDAAALMKNFTESHIGQPMAITLDRKVIVDAVVQGVISDQGEITSPTKLNMTYLIAFVKSGPLPLPLNLIDKP